MEISLNQDSIVDQRTGEVSAPSEYVSNLRAIEVDIQRADDRLAALKAESKAARDHRETLVNQLRGAVREGKCLPLLELADEPAAANGEDDGFDTQNEDD